MKQLDPKSVWAFFIGDIMQSAAFTLGITVFFIMTVVSLAEEGQAVPNLLFLMVIIPVITLIFFLSISYIWAKLTYRFYKYELREDGFRKEHGIIWKKYVTIPYDRIQNVDIYRGVIARLLGLSDLQIQTAGGITAGSYGAFSEGRLPGLSREEAEKIRDEVIKRARHHRSGQGL